ncbi:MAG: hypothetical protein AB7F40_09310 [Victivallaceae bacterium]|nr:hypothetical protein [Victivallaceae bacterium]
MEQELFMLSEKITALSDRVQRQQPVAGHNMVFESTERGIVIGQAPTAGVAPVYSGDFTLIITETPAGTDVPAAAVVDLERGQNSTVAGLVGVTGYSSVPVPRYDFTVMDGDTIVYMRTTLSNNVVTPEIMLTQTTIPYYTTLYDVIEIGRVHYSVTSGALTLEQSWRGGMRTIEYRWW